MMRWLALLFLAFFVWVVASADSGRLPALLQALYAFPLGDKLGHVVLLALLTLAVNTLLGRRRLGPVLLGSALVALAITVEEVSQRRFTLHRTFDLFDLLASYGGIALAEWLLHWRAARPLTAPAGEAAGE